MGGYFLIASTGLYVAAAAGFANSRQWAFAWIHLCYAAANVGMIIAAWTKK